jgi:hypothetical protein
MALAYQYIPRSNYSEATVSTVKRCTSRYSPQVRCELPTGHVERHGHSFYARYWADENRPRFVAKRPGPCWPHPCRDYHESYAHASGEDPCRCCCHA